MAAVGLGVLMATLDMSIINVSLPTLVQVLGTDFPTIQWVILAYVLVITSTMLSMARLGDMVGKKRIYLLGLVIFTIGSGLCGLSPTVNWLIGFRALQGCGAVMVQSLGIALVTEAFPARERGRALGVISGIVSVGLALGPPVGGLIIGLAGWHWIFLINVPIGFLALGATWLFIPAPKTERTGQHFDVSGGLILSATIVAYSLGMTMGQYLGFREARVLLLLAGAVLGLGLFIGVEKKSPQPMLNPRLFKNILFSLNLLMGWLVFIVLGGTFTLPFYLELVKGFTTEQVGLLMMIVPLSMGLISVFSGALSDRFGPRGITLVGLLLLAFGCLSLGNLKVETTVWEYIFKLLPFGAGLGFFLAPNNSAVMGGAPKEHLGVASGLLALSRTLGHTTGIPLAGVLFTAGMMASGRVRSAADLSQAPPQDLVNGLTATFHTTAVMIFIAAALAVLAFWLDRRRGA
ncbi:MAG: MFS transporter [Deltaproteobacteria bacterium]|nr:MFS transporter [Deltaproteobacteria bacterium]